MKKLQGRRTRLQAWTDTSTCAYSIPPISCLNTGDHELTALISHGHPGHFGIAISTLTASMFESSWSSCDTLMCMHDLTLIGHVHRVYTHTGKGGRQRKRPTHH